ncbi:MAG TPA: sulfite exporter TauE/SafE family protein [Hyphomicrobiaceae bacterium]|nr:sulfite exporter TauE/SafE family protein [Hyphomicrobiaceae bacterium]
MTFAEMLLYGGFGLMAGGLIGCVGVGGVILVPALVYLAGIPIKFAIAAAMFAYLLSGAVGTFAFARKKSIRWSMTMPLWLAAMPSALVGALAVNVAPGRLLELLIGLLTAGSGIQALRRKVPADEPDGQNVSNGYLAMAGGVTGFLSALTGTGGPLVLIPILMWVHMPVLTAIGLAQAIQLPIAVLATAGNYYAGILHVSLGLIIGLGIVFGTWGGAWLAHVLPREMLRRIVAVLLALVGASILAKLTIGILL